MENFALTKTKYAATILLSTASRRKLTAAQEKERKVCVPMGFSFS